MGIILVNNRNYNNDKKIKKNIRRSTTLLPTTLIGKQKRHEKKLTEKGKTYRNRNRDEKRKPAVGNDKKLNNQRYPRAVALFGTQNNKMETLRKRIKSTMKGRR